MRSSTKLILVALALVAFLGYLLVYGRGFNEGQARCGSKGPCPLVTCTEKVCPTCPDPQPCTKEPDQAKVNKPKPRPPVTKQPQQPTTGAPRPQTNCDPCRPDTGQPNQNGIIDDSNDVGRPGQTQGGMSQQDLERERIAQTQRDQAIYDQGVRDAQAQQTQQRGHSTRDRVVGTIIAVGGPVAQAAIYRGGNNNPYDRGQNRYVPDGQGGYYDRMYPLEKVQGGNLNLVYRQGRKLDAQAEFFRQRRLEYQQ